MATEFKLQRVGEIALVTIDNGEDHTKPTTFGRAALESLERTLDELESGEWAGLVLTGKPFVFAAGADIDQFPNVTPELAREGSRAGHELFLRLRALPFPTLAATGVRLIAQLAYGLRERKGRYGLTALCIGMGMGAAVLWENVQ